MISRDVLSINRIRLEFKVVCIFSIDAISTGINRIRLEFKVCRKIPAFHNLPCINRIRLEFKLFLESDALCSCFS